MKKAFIVACSIIIVLTCCKGKKSNENVAASDSTITTVPYADPLPEYTQFIQQLDTTDIASVSKASKKFSSLFTNADSTKADSAYVMFHKLYNSVHSYVNELHLKDSTNYRDYVGLTLPKNIKRTKAKDAFLVKLKENGFKLDMSEGMTFIKQDRRLVASTFYQKVSPAMKSFLGQVDKENEEGFVQDAGLMITPVQLSERIIFWEKFMNSSPSFAFAEDIKQTQRGYTTFLLEGIDNSPLFNHGSNKLSEDYQQAFEHVLQSYPTSSLAEIIKPYYTALKNNDRATTKKLLAEYRRKGLIYDYSA